MSLNHVDHKKIKVRLPRGIIQGLLLVLALQSPCLFSSQSLKNHNFAARPFSLIVSDMNRVKVLVTRRYLFEDFYF